MPKRCVSIPGTDRDDWRPRSRPRAGSSGGPGLRPPENVFRVDSPEQFLTHISYIHGRVRDGGDAFVPIWTRRVTGDGGRSSSKRSPVETVGRYGCIRGPAFGASQPSIVGGPRRKEIHGGRLTMTGRCRRLSLLGYGCLYRSIRAFALLFPCPPGLSVSSDSSCC